MPDEQSLSDFERKVLDVVRHPEPYARSHVGVSFEEICAETLLSPDAVTKVIAVLIQEQFIRVLGRADLEEFKVEPVVRAVA
jgi:hypothetical protein